MSDLTKFSEGASILQQVDVSDIFTNLAMGIAEAQQKLDDNSIAQAIKLAETNINGESLLSLGFVPTFYAFQYADISASINLRMGLKEALEFGFGIDVQLSNQKGYSTANREFLSSNSYSETSEEYKSVRQLNFRAKEKKAIKINNKFVSQSESLDSKSRIENFKQKIKNEASVDQVYEEIQSKTITENQSVGVDVWMDAGFLRIQESLHFGKDAVGILKIGNYTDDNTDDIDLNGTDPSGAFSLGTDLAASLQLAVNTNGGTVYGLSKTGVLHFYDGELWYPVSSKFYFPYNSDEITYQKNLKLPSETNNLSYASPYEALPTAVDNENYPEHKLIHKVLRLIQSHDSDVSITITGMTDPKGGDKPQNQSLAKRRAERLCDHIFGSTAPVNVTIGAVTNSPGSSDLLKRHATIELNSDYIIFINGAVTKNATPVKTSSVPNKFVYADDKGEAETSPFNVLNVTYGGTAITASAETFSEILTSAKSQLSNHSHETISDELNYSLYDEAIVKLHLMSNQSNEILIEESQENSSQGTENQSSYLWAKTKNESSALSDSASNSSQNSSFAFAASVDFRMSRQFEMSMEGNSEMSARLVALPAPDKFLDFLNSNYGQTTEG
jgi:hypothetical protein